MLPHRARARKGPVSYNGANHSPAAIARRRARTLRHRRPRRPRRPLRMPRGWAARARLRRRHASSVRRAGGAVLLLVIGGRQCCVCSVEVGPLLWLRFTLLCLLSPFYPWPCSGRAVALQRHIAARGDCVPVYTTARAAGGGRGGCGGGWFFFRSRGALFRSARGA